MLAAQFCLHFFNALWLEYLPHLILYSEFCPPFYIFIHIATYKYWSPGRKMVCSHIRFPRAPVVRPNLVAKSTTLFRVGPVTVLCRNCFCNRGSA